MKDKLRIWLKKYMILDAMWDAQWNQWETRSDKKHEAEITMEKLEHLMDGMTEALNCFGYGVRKTHGEYEVVNAYTGKVVIREGSAS